MKTETQEVLEQVLSEDFQRAQRGNMSDREAAEREAAYQRGRALGAQAGHLRVLLYLPGEELWRTPEGKEEGENAVYFRGGFREAYRSAANPVDLEVEDGEACYAIPADKRRVNMVVRVKDNKLTFQLRGGITNEHWAPYHAARSAEYGAPRACGCNCCGSCATTVERALANMGHDTTCGACMAKAFTGTDGGYKHTCRLTVEAST